MEFQTLPGFMRLLSTAENSGFLVEKAELMAREAATREQKIASIFIYYYNEDQTLSF